MHIKSRYLCPKLVCFQFEWGILICLIWSANFIFGNPKEANWNTKSEIGNIEVLDMRNLEVGLRGG